MIFNSKINDIEIRMIKEKDNCWIKVVPLRRISFSSNLYLNINDEYHEFEIYDKEGKESHVFYFEGLKCNPCLYLKSGKNSYKINCKRNGISIVPIVESHAIEDYLKKNCNCNSPQASCWAKAVYYTSRPDKTPFNEM